MRKVTQFEASDGKRFENKREAEQHEAYLSFKADLGAGLDAGDPLDQIANDLWSKHVQVNAKGKSKHPADQSPSACGDAKSDGSSAPSGKQPPLALAS